MSRTVKTFLCAALALAADAACARPKLAFQAYAVRDLCERDFPGVLKAARAMGCEGVETGRLFGLDAKGLKAACEEAGLELVALQLFPHCLAGAQLEETIRFCEECGAKRINVAWFKGSGEVVNDWQLLVNVLNHAAEVCARHGISIAYHNHAHEFEMELGGRKAMSWLYEGNGEGLLPQTGATPRFSPLVKQEFDPGWCVLAGGDPLQWLAAHPHRNPTVHIMPAIPGGPRTPPPGECSVGSPYDKVDWRTLLPALERDGVEWLVVKPVLHVDSLADLEASIAFLKRSLAHSAQSADK